jgi:hypothetical protein
MKALKAFHEESAGLEMQAGNRQLLGRLKPGFSYLKIGF